MLPMLGLVVQAHAQESNAEAGGARATQLATRISISQTVTDNVHLSNAAQQQSEQITEVSPGISMSSYGSRFKGQLDYSLSEISYAQGSLPRHRQNALNAFGTLEAIEKWGFIDINGSISQQAISAFGTPSNNSTFNSINQTEVSNYRISPYARGHLGSLASYDIRYSRSTLRSDAAALGGVVTEDSVVKVAGDSTLKSLAWEANTSRQSVDFSAGRPTESDRLDLGLVYAISPQLSVSANVGRESNNYTSLEKIDSGTSGIGLRWNPSSNTKFSATINRHSFGDMHSLTFEHRTGRTAWTITDSRDVSGTSLSRPGNLGSAYNLYYSQFEPVQPDPALRAEMVNAFLQSNGIRPNDTVTSSFLTTAMSLLRRQSLSFALLGVRDTVTFMATRTENSRLDTLSTGVDDFNTSALIRQSGFSVNLAHRLTVDYVLSAVGSQQLTSGISDGQDSNFHSLYITLTGKLGPRSLITLGAHRNVSDGNVVPYQETSFNMLWTFQF